MHFKHTYLALTFSLLTAPFICTIADQPKPLSAQQVCAVLQNAAQGNNDFYHGNFDTSRDANSQEYASDGFKRWVAEAIADNNIQQGSTAKGNTYIIYQGKQQNIPSLDYYAGGRLANPAVAILIDEKGKTSARVVFGTHVTEKNKNAATIFATNLRYINKDAAANADLLNVVEQKLKKDGAEKVWIDCARMETDRWYNEQGYAWDGRWVKELQTETK